MVVSDSIEQKSMELDLHGLIFEIMDWMNAYLVC